jgi:hypothetical protein
MLDFDVDTLAPGGSTMLTIELNNPIFKKTRFALASSSANITLSEDTVMVMPGDSVIKVNVTAMDDLDDQSITVTIESLSNNVDLDDMDAMVQIFNPAASINAIAITGTDQVLMAGGTKTFTVTLSEAAQENISISFTSNNAGVTVSPNPLVIPAGATSGTATLSAAEGTADGTATISLSSTSNKISIGDDDELTVQVQAVQVSISDLTEAQLSLYPNPATQGSTLIKTDLTGTVQILSVSGELVKELSIISGQEQEISTTDMASGIYSIHIIGESKSYSTKLVVQ